MPTSQRRQLLGTSLINHANSHLRAFALPPPSASKAFPWFLMWPAPYHLSYPSSSVTSSDEATSDHHTSITTPFVSLSLLFLILWPHLRHMEAPGSGTELEPQLWQCQILNPLCQAGDQTCASVATWASALRFLTHHAIAGTLPVSLDPTTLFCIFCRRKNNFIILPPKINYVFICFWCFSHWPRSSWGPRVVPEPGWQDNVWHITGTQEMLVNLNQSQGIHSSHSFSPPLSLPSPPDWTPTEAMVNASSCICLFNRDRVMGQSSWLNS